MFLQVIIFFYYIRHIFLSFSFSAHLVEVNPMDPVVVGVLYLVFAYGPVSCRPVKALGP